MKSIIKLYLVVVVPTKRLWGRKDIHTKTW